MRTVKSMLTSDPSTVALRFLSCTSIMLYQTQRFTNGISPYPKLYCWQNESFHWLSPKQSIHSCLKGHHNFPCNCRADRGPFAGAYSDNHTFHILHNHAQVALGLKGAEHADHKGVLSKSQDISLHKSLLDLVPQN